MSLQVNPLVQYQYSDPFDRPFPPPPGLGSGDGSWSSASFINGQQVSKLTYRFDPQDSGGSLAQLFQPEEDFWVSQVAPSIPEPTVIWFSDDWAIDPNFDEDFWQNQVNPVIAANLFPQPGSFETGEFVPAPLFVGQADEDFWINHVVSKERVLQAPQQAQFDSSDQASLFGQFDEDFWTNSVAPVQAALYQALPLGADEQFFGVPGPPDQDGNYWYNMVTPVAPGMFLVYPYFYDTDEAVLQPVVASTGQGGYLVYGLQLVNRHLNHI